MLHPLVSLSIATGPAVTLLCTCVQSNLIISCSFLLPLPSLPSSLSLSPHLTTSPLQSDISNSEQDSNYSPIFKIILKQVDDMDFPPRKRSEPLSTACLHTTWTVLLPSANEYFLVGERSVAAEWETTPSVPITRHLWFCATKWLLLCATAVGFSRLLSLSIASQGCCSLVSFFLPCYQCW